MLPPLSPIKPLKQEHQDKFMIKSMYHMFESFLAFTDFLEFNANGMMDSKQSAFDETDYYYFHCFIESLSIQLDILGDYKTRNTIKIVKNIQTGINRIKVLQRKHNEAYPGESSKSDSAILELIKNIFLLLLAEFERLYCE